MTLVDTEPHLVIGIHEGGSHVLTALKESDKLSDSYFAQAKLNRPIKSKKSKSLVAPLLKVLPQKLTDWMRVYEIDILKKRIPQIDTKVLEDEKIDLNISLRSDKTIGSVLIVDDALDSGRTMFIVRHNIQKIFPKAQIKTAVITWTLNESIIKPDFYL